MARISATASLGIKKSMEGKPGWGKYDNVNPNHSITLERQVSDDLTDVQLVAKADELNKLARKLVEQKINNDIKELGEWGK